MSDTATRIAGVSDQQLTVMHALLDKGDPVDPAQAEAHHLVTVEMLKRGLDHAHTDDEWAAAAILIDEAEVSGPDEIAAPDGMEKAWADTLANGGTVSVFLTVDGYVLKADPGVGAVHVDAVMSNGKKKKRRMPTPFDDEEVAKSIEPVEYDDPELLESFTPDDRAHFAEVARILDFDGDPDLMVAKGNPEPLRDYWRAGGKGKINWGAGGDFTACAAAVSKYMTDEEAKGYCAIRHREVTGMWPGDKRNRAQKSMVPAATFTLPDGSTYTYMLPTESVVEPVIKHPGHADQKVHGHHGGGQTSLPPGVKGRIKATIGKGAIAESYGPAYAKGKAHSKGQDEHGEPLRWSPRNNGSGGPMAHHMRERDAAVERLMASPKGSFESEGLAMRVLDHQGFIDGATGARPLFRRSHTFGEALAGLMFGGLSGATKAAEPVEKHPGHANQKVHGRKGGGSPDVPKRSTPKGGDGSPVGTTINSYPEAVRRQIRRKPEHVSYAGEEIVKGRDSVWDHLVPDPDKPGEYRLTPERAAIHEQIIAKRLEGKPSQDDPVFVMMGGGGGAGKGTLLESGLLKSVPGEDERVHIDADEIKMEIPDYGRLVSSGRKTEVAGFTHEESSIISKEIQRRAIQQRSHILLDGTGDSSEDSLRRKIEGPRAAGYKVVGEYVTVPTRVAWDRNVERAASGPRGLVPPSELVKAHKSVSSIVPRMSAEFDEFRLWDSTDGRGKQVVIASTTRGSTLKVTDRSRFKTFLDKADEPISTDQLLADIPQETWTRIRETTS